MGSIIKAIRTAGELSQEQFARELGTTLSAIRSWENKEAEPNGIEQSKLISYCSERKIELEELVVREREYNFPCQQLVLYHGSKNGIIKSRRNPPRIYA